MSIATRVHIDDEFPQGDLLFEAKGAEIAVRQIIGGSIETAENLAGLLCSLEKGVTEDRTMALRNTIELCLELCYLETHDYTKRFSRWIDHLTGRLSAEEDDEYRLEPVKEDSTERTAPDADLEPDGQVTLAEVVDLIERYNQLSDTEHHRLFDCIIDMTERTAPERDCDRVAELLIRLIGRLEDAGTLDTTAANMLNVIYRGTSHCCRSLGALSKEVLRSMEWEEAAEPVKTRKTEVEFDLRDYSGANIEFTDEPNCRTYRFEMDRNVDSPAIHVTFSSVEGETDLSSFLFYSPAVPRSKAAAPATLEADMSDLDRYNAIFLGARGERLFGFQFERGGQALFNVFDHGEISQSLCVYAGDRKEQ